MRRLLAVTMVLVAASAGGAAFSACAASDLSSTRLLDGSAGTDARIIDFEGGDALTDGGLPPGIPSCERYCDLVAENCKGPNAQYASTAECRAFCEHLVEGKIGETDESTVGCRQYYAGNPARTNPSEHCSAAGPFGGNNKCGSRCTAFCEVGLSACGDASTPYATKPACESACTGYIFMDEDEDGGGEGPTGPTSGDTLNCRLYWLRRAVLDAGACPQLREQSASCN